MKRFPIVLAILFIAVVAFYQIENWRGSNRLAEVATHLKSEGEVLDPATLRPEPVPPEQNFFAIEEFAPLFVQEPDSSPEKAAGSRVVLPAPIFSANLTAGWTNQGISAEELFAPGQISLSAWVRVFKADRRDFDLGDADSPPAERLQRALSRFDKDFESLAMAAAQRPQSQFPLVLQGDGREVFESAMKPYRWVNMLGFQEFLLLKAVVAMELGDEETALDCARILSRVIEAFHNEPFAMPLALALASIDNAQKIFEEGLHRHTWSKAGLEWFARESEKWDPWDHCLDAFRGEVALIFVAGEVLKEGAFVDHLGSGSFGTREKLFVRLMPSGWWDQNIANFCEKNFLHNISPLSKNDARGLTLQNRHEFYGRPTPYTVFARSWSNLLQGFVGDAYEIQFNRDALRLACALEQHALLEGDFPTSLESLVPRFIHTIPENPLTKEPLSMKRSKQGYELVGAEIPGIEGFAEWKFSFSRKEVMREVE